MPDAFDRLFDAPPDSGAKKADAFDRLFGAGAASTDAEAIRYVRTHAFGDVADESKTPATPEDLVTVADRLGMRRKVAKTDFPMERYLAGGVADDEIAAKQAEFDAPVVADLERQAGPIRTKADVRRLTDAADVARAQAQYTAEHPTHPKMPDQFTDPAEARRLMVEAPDRRRERAEYEKAGVASPFLALTGARVARAASFGAIDMEKMAPPEQRRILAAQAETATPVERFGTGIAETASMMATVNPFAKGLTTALKALKVSEGTAATVGNLLAASAHGGITEGSVEGAVRTGVFMGGQTALGRVFRGAAPTAGRYAGSEFGAGATASAIAQLATEGHVDPVQTLSDAVTNALFGLGGARAAGKARRAEADAVVEAARQRLTEEIRKGRELQDILRDADFAAMVKQAQARPGEGAEMLAEPARPVAPDLVAENEMLAGSRTPEIAPESDVSIPTDAGPTSTTKASEKAIRKAGKGDSRTLDWQYEGERFAPNRDLPDATKAPKRWVDEYAPPVDPDVRPPPAPAPLVPEGMERLGAPEPVKGEAPPDWSDGFVGERPVPPDIPTEPTPRPGKADIVQETPEAKERRIGLGYDTVIEIDPSKFKEKFEAASGERLGWDRGRARLAAGRETFNEHPLVGVGPDGNPVVSDGRHRIAEAARRGVSIKVAVQGADAQKIRAIAEAGPANGGAIEPPTLGVGLPDFRDSSAYKALAERAKSDPRLARDLANASDLATNYGSPDGLLRLMRNAGVLTPEIEADLTNQTKQIKVRNEQRGYATEHIDQYNAERARQIRQWQKDYERRTAPKSVEEARDRAVAGLRLENAAVAENPRLEDAFRRGFERVAYGVDEPRPKDPTEARLFDRGGAEAKDAVDALRNRVEDRGPDKELPGGSRVEGGRGLPQGSRESVVDVEARPVEAAPAEAPAPRPGKQAERGAVDVSGAAATAARGVRTVLGTETQKIRDLGTPSAREFADLLEKADDVRQERSGPITPARRRVEIFASRPGNRSAAKSLTTPDVVRDTVDGEPVTYALPRGERIVNGEATARSPKESQLVDLIEAYWQERGKGFEAVGTMRTDPKTGERVPFKTPKGTWPRIPHQDGLDLMLIGERDKAWAPLVRAVAHANGIPVNAAGKILGKMRERLLGLSGVTGPETGRVSEAEVFRELKHMPSDIWVRGPMGTRRISILETDPVTVVRRATDMGTSRMGVIASFGQDLGDDPKIDALRRKFLSENAGRGFDPTVVWDKAIRMAHAIPKNDPTWTASHPMAPLARGIKSFFGLVKTGKMSNRWAPNVFEWTGAPREFVGLANQAKVQLQRFRDFVQTGEGREAVARDLERRGAIIDEGLAIPSNPSHPFSQALHITRQLMDTATLGRPMESSQEHGFARGADLRLKQMQARKGQGESHAGERDVLRLMQVGVPETQARKLAYGEGTQAEYDTALRTAMNKAIGANTSQLSRSPLENSKVGKLLWYNSWASMNLRHAGRTMLATVRGVESAFAPGLAPQARVRRLGAATRTFLSWATGRAVSNAAATAVVSLVTGGTTGLSANVAEAKDDFGKFLTKSFLYGIVGGPYAAIIRNAGDNLSKQIQGVATPVSVVSDMIDAVSGSGRYMDKSGGARVAEIVRTYIPFVKSVISATAAVTGDTVRLHNDAAERAYFQWRRESGLYEKSKAYEKEPSEFRAAVSTITDLIEAGKMTSAREEYEKAQKIKAPKNTTLAKSIMDRRLLTIPDMKRNAEGDPNPAEALEMMKALRRHIGETAYADLENRDKRIMEFLNTLGKGR